MTSRGCPYDCEFCCVTNLFGKQIRHVPIENVVRDIKEAHAKNFIFLDDNVIGHPRYAKELFKAIIPLKINWVGQASISLLVNNNELLRLAAESGCKALFIGIESVGEQVLHTMPKVVSKIKQLGKGISKVKKMGILVHASMIFGFDNDTKEIILKIDRFRFLSYNEHKGKLLSEEVFDRIESELTGVEYFQVDPSEIDCRDCIDDWNDNNVRLIGRGNRQTMNEFHILVLDNRNCILFSFYGNFSINDINSCAKFSHTAKINISTSN